MGTNPVTSTPGVLGGTPCFAGTRVPVATLFDYLQRGYTVAYFLDQFPSVKPEQVRAVLDLAKAELESITRHVA